MVSQRKRAITVYLDTAEEKQAFDATAARLGLSTSVLGSMLFRRAIASGMLGELAAAIPAAKVIATVVKSKQAHSRVRATPGKKPAHHRDHK